jgi:uncharacterized protein (UPF0333 family)
MKINNIILLVLSIAVIYLLFFKKEKMTADVNTKKLIQDHYKIDVDAIRNLSLLANDLTKNGKLRVPGGLEVDGKLTVKGNLHAIKEGDGYLANFKKNTENKGRDGTDYKTKSGIEVTFKNNNSGTSFTHDTRGMTDLWSKLVVNDESHFRKDSKFYKPTWFQNQLKPNVWSHMNWTDGNMLVRGNIIMDGSGGTGKDLHVHGNSYLAIRDGQAKVHIDAPNKNGRIITHGANKKQNVLIDRAHQGGRILVKNDNTDRWVTGMESHNFGGHVIVNHRDGQHRIHLNGQGDRSEINFSGHKPALLQAHDQRLALRGNHIAFFNRDHYRLRTLHHDCNLTQSGEGHTFNTRC